MTPPPDLIELFVRPLERLGVEYVITGGVAAVSYGDPRFTRDVDLVLELDAAAVSDLLAGFDPGEFYLPPGEVVSEEARRSEGGHFNIIHHEFALRADVTPQGKSFFTARLRRVHCADTRHVRQGVPAAGVRRVAPGPAGS